MGQRKRWQYILILILSLTMCVSLFGNVKVFAVPPASTISYTDVDYSSQVTVGESVEAFTDENQDVINTEYWWFYVDGGYTINLTAGKLYRFYYSVSSRSGDVGYLEPAMVILTGGAFNGIDNNYFGDDLDHAEDGFFASKANLTILFEPATSGSYRILTGAALYEDLPDGVDTELLVEEVPGLGLGEDFTWSAELPDSDSDDWPYTLFTTVAEDGTIYTISNISYRSWQMVHVGDFYFYRYDGTYTLYAYSAQGDKLWEYDLTLPSFSQPLVGPDGTIYAATLHGFLADDDDDEFSDYGFSRLIALNPDGSEKWVKRFDGYVDDGYLYIYNFDNQLALSKSGILVATSYNNDFIFGFDTNNNGNPLWRVGDWKLNMETEVYNSWTSLSIYQDTVYVPTWFDDVSSGIAAYNALDGTELWRINVGYGVFESSVSIDKDGILYMINVEPNPDDEDIFYQANAINPDGSIKWSRAVDFFDSGVFATAIDDQYLYVSSGDRIYVLDKSSGNIEKDFSGFPAWNYTSSLLADSRIILTTLTEDYGILIYVLNSDGTLNGIRYIAGASNYESDFPMPVISKNGAYVITVSGVVYSLDLGSEDEKGWSVNGANGGYTNSIWSFEVDFESNGGTSVNSQTVWNGDSADKPADPTRDDEVLSPDLTRRYTFDKWYADEDLTVPYDFSAAVLNDITLYAGWTSEDITTDPDPEDGDKNGDDPKDDNPQTADKGLPVLWMAIFGASLLTVIGFEILRKKKVRVKN